MLEHFGIVLATHMLMDGDYKVGVMHHAQPYNRIDSGWEFFCGKETQEYLDDVANIGVYDIHTILEKDPAILPYLTKPVDTFWVRVEGMDQFEEVLED